MIKQTRKRFSECLQTPEQFNKRLNDLTNAYIVCTGLAKLGDMSRRCSLGYPSLTTSETL